MKKYLPHLPTVLFISLFYLLPQFDYFSNPKPLKIIPPPGEKAVLILRACGDLYGKIEGCGEQKIIRQSEKDCLKQVEFFGEDFARCEDTKILDQTAI